ncbi:MAG: tyrosine-type recombinase/integrase [Candidatus Peregrinibacteria bacterium]
MSVPENFYLQRMKEEMLLRNYSPRTISSYLRCVVEFLVFLRENFKGKGENKNESVPAVRQQMTVENIYGNYETEIIRIFLLHKKSRNYAPETINLYLNAIKFFYGNVLKSSFKIDIKFARRNIKLPVVLARDEIIRIISSLQNLKHRLAIALAYGAGLRVSEVSNLKVQDLDFANGVMYIRNSKSRKDRVTLLPEKLVDDMRTLVKFREKKDYVFPGRNGKITARALQKVFNAALEKAGVGKSASFHSLRHSFATHLIENGTSVIYVQELLGHLNIRTTQRYIHAAGAGVRLIKSPL